MDVDPLSVDTTSMSSTTRTVKQESSEKLLLMQIKPEVMQALPEVVFIEAAAGEDGSQQANAQTDNSENELIIGPKSELQSNLASPAPSLIKFENASQQQVQSDSENELIIGPKSELQFNLASPAPSLTKSENASQQQQAANAQTDSENVGPKSELVSSSDLANPGPTLAKSTTVFLTQPEKEVYLDPIKKSNPLKMTKSSVKRNDTLPTYQ